MDITARRQPHPSTPVPAVDIAAQNESLRPEIDAAMRAVVDQSGFVLGEAVEAFEQSFAAYIGVDHCIGVNSGTSALHLAMEVLDIGPGDEVVTVSMSFIATAWPIRYLGATPVFVDIDPARYTMDPTALAAAITPRTKAIVPVHLYGQCADMDAILEVACRHGLPVIEDAAQAAGADYGGRRAGALGTIGCFSFYPTKTLGCFGDGGAVTTNDPALAKRIRMLRDHGQSARYVHEMVGYNYRLDSLQAAVLGVKLPHLDDWANGRRRIARTYDEALAGTSLDLPKDFADGTHVYHQYVVQTEDRDGLRQSLQDRGVGTGIHYPMPIHRQPAFAEHNNDPLPVTEKLARSCVSLPIYPELTDGQIESVVEGLRAIAT